MKLNFDTTGYSVRVIETYNLFSEITEKLIILLSGLDKEQWELPTCYPSWKVKDIAAHLIQTSISRLSIQRDGYSGSVSLNGKTSFQDLSAFIDEANSSWSDTFSAISPRVLLDIIKVAERQLADFIQTQDIHSKAPYPVSWAGESVSENWFDLV